MANLLTILQGVFTELIEKLNVKGLQFHEFLSIDPETLSEVQPLYGLIFLFKYRGSEIRQRRVRQQTASAGAVFGPDVPGAHYDEVSASIPISEQPDKGVFFAHQTIQDACATQAVLSLLLNFPPGQEDVDVGPVIKNFGEFVESFDPELRGEAISNSEEIRAVHNSFSRPNPFVDEDQNDTERDENNDGLYHFIAYLPIHGKLYELDGLHPYPIVHDVGGAEVTLESFPALVSKVLMERVANSPAGEMRFALLGLTKDPRPMLRAIGDTDGLEREESKRAAWSHENALRRENYIGLINALVRSVSGKLTDAEWQSQVIEAGRSRSQARIERIKAQKERNFPEH